jgi:2-hydroxy-3-keto-5-methylthiopentenyl-1-phosphate phosphatase
MKNIAVLCDFDGTVADDDVGNLLFRTFTEGGASREVVNRWKEGLISSRECLERECALARLTKDTLDRFIRKRRIDEYFKDFLDFAKKRGMEIVIVSDGLDYYIEKMLLRHGVAEIEFFANQLDISNGSLRVDFPYYDLMECTDCGNCKRHHLEKFKDAGYFVVYVGNGLSDRCPAEYADLVFAKGDLLAHCRKTGIDCIAFENFRDVERELLKRLVLDEAGMGDSPSDH